uniref:Nuclear pore complex protein n=1 Tax=Glossina brevipalpis TaxID=37001 RepID=A0A1A9WZW9_9MUSC
MSNKKQQQHNNTFADGAGDDGRRHNFSVTLMPHELQRILDQSHHTNVFNNSFKANMTSMLLDSSICERSGSVEVLETGDFSKKIADILVQQFLEVLKIKTNESDIFDTIQDLKFVCAGVLESTKQELSRGGDEKRRWNSCKWLEQELKTWELLYALYKDRILVQCGDEAMGFDGATLGGSEKEVISQLYNCNSTLREYQLIIDWLEACYERRNYGPLIGQTSDRSVSWDNTLFQLKKKKQLAFDTGAEIVKSLDPDAPIREKRPLHALDEEDSMRLSRCIFQEVRQGRFDEATNLCKYYGQSWRAAIFEGWRLHEDPNYDTISANNSEKLSIEGNPRRDVWKKCAWLMADSKKFDEYTRAIAGAFAGHLDSLKSLLGNSWEDLLWAYLKVQVDIRVESEIRACCLKPYHPLPEAYWNAKMSLEQIFDELLVHNDADVRDYAQSKIGIIQKYFILDNISELLQQMRRWIDNEDADCETECIPITPHMLRFLTHIVLFMRQIGRADKDETSDHVIAAYVESLILMGDAQLVAFYTAHLPTKIQISLYSKFLEKIHEREARSLALGEAINAGLDVEEIIRHTVETIRQTIPTDIEVTSQLQAGEISEFDQRKIKALEWLTFQPSQRGELLWQANAMIRSYLAENKSECVGAIYNIIPSDSLGQIIKLYSTADNIPYREDCSIKEYLSYKVYLTAIDSFNEWTRLYHNRPKKPQQATAGATFTERVASEHREQLYQAESNHWNATFQEQVKVCRDSLFNVLVFPEMGWLIDPDVPKNFNKNDVVWETRLTQLERLRSICIPEIVLLLHKVLYVSNDFQGCIKLADEIASETRQIYKVYTKHKLAELLSKLADSSLELLNKNVGGNPLKLWNIHTKNGYTKRVYDEDIKSMVLEIMGTNVSTMYISTPRDNNQQLGIKLPFLVLLIKNMHKYFTFEVKIIDDQRFMRRFRVSNFQSKTSVKPFCTSMPMGMSPGWNQIHFNLADFTRRAYGTNYMETVRLQIHANVRIRRIYFTDRLYQESELPNEYRLIGQPKTKKPITWRVPAARPSSPQTIRGATARSGKTPTPTPAPEVKKEEVTEEVQQPSPPPPPPLEEQID